MQKILIMTPYTNALHMYRSFDPKSNVTKDANSKLEIT